MFSFFKNKTSDTPVQSHNADGGQHSSQPSTAGGSYGAVSSKGSVSLLARVVLVVGLLVVLGVLFLVGPCGGRSISDQLCRQATIEYFSASSAQKVIGRPSACSSAQCERCVSCERRTTRNAPSWWSRSFAGIDCGYWTRVSDHAGMRRSHAVRN